MSIRLWTIPLLFFLLSRPPLPSPILSSGLFCHLLQSALSPLPNLLSSLLPLSTRSLPHHFFNSFPPPPPILIRFHSPLFFFHLPSSLPFVLSLFCLPPSPVSAVRLRSSLSSPYILLSSSLHRPTPLYPVPATFTPSRSGARAFAMTSLPHSPSFFPFLSGIRVDDLFPPLNTRRPRGGEHG